MIDLRDYTLENVLGVLIEELPHADRGELRERAQGFIAVAESAAVPIEALLRWIHTDTPGKEYSLREFRAFCAALVAERQQAPAPRPPDPPRLREHLQDSLFGTASDIAAFDPN